MGAFCGSAPGAARTVEPAVPVEQFSLEAKRRSRAAAASGKIGQCDKRRACAVFAPFIAMIGGTVRYLDQLLLGRNIGWAINVYSITACVATGIAALVTTETCGLYPHKLYLHEVKAQ